MSRPLRAIVLSPEAPYPIAGGGPMRTASIVEFLRERYTVHLVVFREPGAPEPSFPEGVSGSVVDLPFHSKSIHARAIRNLQRASRRIPPLVDRFSGFEEQVAAALSPPYDIGIIEHFWAAGYAKVLRPVCRRLLLDLHNIESVLLRRQATGVSALLFHRFASGCEELEKAWLPLFDDLLVTSEHDRSRVGSGIVYPNAVAEVPLPKAGTEDAIAFSGNLAYQPNIEAVAWFAREVWPHLRGRYPDLRWRLIGKGDSAMRHLLQSHGAVEFTGPISEPITELARTKLAVVPIHSGSGTRVKIIEAWAAGVPVVSTTIGAEGLPCASGEHLLLADSPEAFRDAVVRVLEDAALAARLSANGRRLYETQLTWRSVWQSLEKAGL